VRVVLDARPLQAPERNPTTAIYLEALLGAFAAEPVPDESFLFLLDSPGPDPSPRFPGLSFAGRRRLPPTRRLRAARLTMDPFLLRAASIGGRGGAAAAILHVTGGTVPLASGLPMVVTLLDLAPWELPAVYQRNIAERFGQRLRARLLREAERIIVASEATARATSRFLPFPRERIHVVPLAPVLPPADGHDLAGRVAQLRERLRLPERYLLFRGQYDARKDLATLLQAMVALAGAPAPVPPPVGGTWPPVLVLAPSDTATASGGESEALARLVDREGAWPVAHLTPHLDAADQALLLAGARALVHPALVEGSALPAIEALAVGIPVVASNVGALSEIVGRAGILVPPRDARRLGAAVSTIWSDERLHARLSRAATRRGPAGRRTWADVARETRHVYALAASRRRA
jgi:glycosyltransferase involved in cell wall biosynthesis